MLKSIVKSFAVAGFVLAMATPASADSPIVVLSPHLEIRIGTSRPPERRREVRPRFPGWGYAWVQGAWDWQGDHWVWIEGRWERPERHVYWVPARYAPEHDHWRYAPGHWSNQSVHEGDHYRQWKDERRNRPHDKGNRGEGRGHGRVKHK